jgi:hypothetical protein
VTENRSVGGSIPPLGTICCKIIKYLDKAAKFESSFFRNGDVLGTQLVDPVNVIQLLQARILTNDLALGLPR